MSKTNSGPEKPRGIQIIHGLCTLGMWISLPLAVFGPGWLIPIRDMETRVFFGAVASIANAFLLWLTQDRK
ncbi:hypothetical protein CA54_51280 [Symmachiella macrocystis]|uniref:Uncharacterized protein n=1 Tax=Symmachiella macrocystis TaxID=2527985 RepID=A0A5C6B5Z0_9PLAN|nr:hypothetical protein [Symmachiella macrocystis]TWU06729.1 hypothetical protein CA54_51280 [Symmachiella macrocystis]